MKFKRFESALLVHKSRDAKWREHTASFHTDEGIITLKVDEEKYASIVIGTSGELEICEDMLISFTEK